MARIVNSVFTPNLVLNVNVIKTDGSVESKQFKVNDEVTNLRYVSDKQIKKATGRVAEITYSFPNSKLKRYYNNIAKLKSWFKYDVKAENIIVDGSTEKHSDLIAIPVRELLEDDGVVDVERIKYFLSYGFSASIEMSDNTTNSFSIKEGDVVSNIVYLYKGEEATISGKVVAIKYDTTLQPVAIEMNVDGVAKEIAVEAIVKAGASQSPISSTANLTSAIASNTSGVVLINEGIYPDSVTITKSITIKGNKAGISAFKSTRDKKTFVDETVISGKITLSGEVDVVLDGLTLTGDALMSLGDAASVEIKNCIITGITPSTNRDYLISTGSGTPTKLTISRCFFGAYKTGSGRIYNLFELNCSLKDGSSITENYFQNGIAANNNICIYNVNEGATITINGNIWEFSGNGIRVGTKNNPLYTVIVSNNEYKATYETDNVDYAGLLLVQPYGKQTTSMSNATIKISGTKRYDKNHIWYMYTGKNDMAFNIDNVPTIYLDGTKVDPMENYIDETPPAPTKTEIVASTAPASLNTQLSEAVINGLPVEVSVNEDITIAEGQFIEIPSGAPVTMNLAEGVTISGKSALIDVKPGAKLTLTGSGEIVTSTKNTNPAVSVDAGEVVLDGVTIDVVKGTDGVNNFAYGIYARNGGTVTVKSGKIITALGSCIGSNNTTGTANVVITGGELYNDGSYALYFGGQNITNITGGKVQGINARMGNITIGGDAEIIPTTIDDTNNDPIGSNIGTSGCIWLGDTIVGFLGSYTARDTDEDGANFSLTIKDNAKVTSNFRAGVAIYKIDTNQNYDAVVNIADTDMVKTTDTDFDAISVYDHEYLTAQATAAGKTYTSKVDGNVIINVAGEKVYPVEPTVENLDVIDGDDPVDGNL